MTNVDDAEWASRSALWDQQARRRPAGYKPKRQRRVDPLVLCGHGITLKVDHGALVVRNGFSHYPQAREEYRFFKGDISLPKRIIVLDGSGTISFDVVSWIAAQGVDLVRVNWRGDAVSVIAGAGRAAQPDMVREQMDIRGDSERRVTWCCDLISRKIEASVETLQTTLPPSDARERALNQADKALAQLRSSTVRSVQDVLLIEALAASVYFKAWRGLPMRWRSTKTAPVPATWMKVGARNAPAGRFSLSNRNATHPLNAMLNYAYGVLQGHVQILVAGTGLDPNLGIMHESRPDAPALVLDLMEPFRPVVDAAVFKFALSAAFGMKDFLLTDEGVCRLNPQLARRIAQVTAGAVDRTPLGAGITR